MPMVTVEVHKEFLACADDAGLVVSGVVKGK